MFVIAAVLFAYGLNFVQCISELDQSHKSKVQTIMKNQFYTHFENEILYTKSGMGNKLYS